MPACRSSAPRRLAGIFVIPPLRLRLRTLLMPLPVLLLGRPVLPPLPLLPPPLLPLPLLLPLTPLPLPLLLLLSLLLLPLLLLLTLLLLPLPPACPLAAGGCRTGGGNRYCCWAGPPASSVCAAGHPAAMRPLRSVLNTLKACRSVTVSSQGSLRSARARATRA